MPDTSALYMETLRRMALELGPQRSFMSALRFLLRTLAERHAFLRPHLVIFDPATRTLRLFLADTPPTAEGEVYEPGVGITGQVFTLGQPVIVERLSENALFKNKFFNRTPEEMRSLSFLSVPVLGRTEDLSEGLDVLGVLSLDLPLAPRAELEECCRFLQVVAALIGTQVSYQHQEMAARQAQAGWGGDFGAGAFASGGGGTLVSAGVVTVSKAMRQVLALVTQAAASRGSVFLHGEAGTGKEMLAGILHRMGPRCDMPCIRVNLAAMPAERLATELLGVQKGALPSVMHTRKGLLEKAHMGTLYVQGLELLPQPLQRVLLRAVQEHEVLRVGGSRPVHVDVRLVWGTQRSLEELRHEGLVDGEGMAHFLAWDIAVPSLRERTEDILPLAEHFLQAAAAAQGRSIRRISTAAVDLLLQHAWPGNAHELQHCVERALLACDGDAILAWHLPPSLQREEAGSGEAVGFTEAVARFEQELLVDALQRAKGNMLEASRLLDTSYRIINYKVKKYGLDARKFVGRGER